MRETQSQDVSDWAGFVTAMNDANVGTINLTGDITVNKNVTGISNPHPLLYPDELKLTGEHISRAVTIVGNNHTMDFGKYYLELNNDRNNTDPWKITLKELNLKRESTSDAYKTSPFYLYNTKNGQITLENVNANLKNSGLAYAEDNQATNGSIILKGTNNIIIQSDGNAPFEAIHSTGDLTVANGAVINFNNDAAKNALHVTGTLNNKNISGLVANNENSFTTLTIGQNAKVNMEMGSGNSAALFAGQMHIQKNADVEINTHQDGARGTFQGGDFNAAEVQQAFKSNPGHVGVVTLGWIHEQPLNDKKTSSSYIDDGATLKITRPSTTQGTVAPLMAFASANTRAHGLNFKFIVKDGATLDLQDAANTNGARINTAEFNNAKYLGNKDNYAFPGLITMWGSGATNDLEFGKVKNVNLQRIGTQKGILISLHGGMEPSVSIPVTTEKLGNKVLINQNGNGFIPLNYVDQSGHKYTWNIKNFASYNFGGNDFSFNFVPKSVNYFVGTDGQPYLNLRKPYSEGGAYGVEFADPYADDSSNGSVELDDGTAIQNGLFTGERMTDKIKSFGQKFNWWNPTSISFGTDYRTEAEKYSPEGGAITVNEGHTLTGGPASTTNPTDAQKAVKDFKDADGNTVTPAVDSYTWESTPDTNTFGEKTGVVTVTYHDGSKDDVVVTVNVKSMADQYDPKGQDVTAIKGQQPAPAAETAISNKTSLPEGTTYTWVHTPDTSKVGVVPSIVNVTYPDGSVDQVPVNVVVGDTSQAEKTTEADKNDPQGKTVDTPRGFVPDPSTAITWPNGQPTNKDGNAITPRYTWSTTPDVSSVGNHPGVVQVTYPDRSVDYVPTNVNVTNTPTAGNPVVVNPDDTLPTPGSSNVNWGNGTEPSGTTYDWETIPTTPAPGQTTTGTVKITYPGDHGSTTVIVPIVNNKPANDPNTGKKVNFNPYGKTVDVKHGAALPAPENMVTNVPTNATDVHYDWTNTPNTNQTGLQQGTVRVTATVPVVNDDGTPTSETTTVTREVPVWVNVGSEADAHVGSQTPVANELKTHLGTLPQITKNDVSNLPSDASIEWSAQTPNVNKPGESTGLARVTYGDGSTQWIPVNVHVKYTAPTAGSLSTTKGTVPDLTNTTTAKGAITNLDPNSKGAGIPSGAEFADPTQVTNDVKNVTTTPVNETVTVSYRNANGDVIYRENVKVPMTVSDNEAGLYDVNYKDVTVKKNDPATIGQQLLSMKIMMRQHHQQLLLLMHVPLIHQIG